MQRNDGKGSLSMLEVTWLGHSTWSIKSEGRTLLLDPFLTDNPKASCKAEQLHADMILVSHGHFDHVQDVASIANRCGSLVVANFEIATWFANKQGVQKTLGMNLGGWGATPMGRVKQTLAFHSSELPDGSYGGNPAGFVARLPEATVYYAGDTALFSDMSLIGNLGIDIAIVPIGDLFTMGIDDSIQAIEWLRPKFVLPTHYNTWPPIEQDVEAWKDAVAHRTSSQPIVLQPGSRWVFPGARG